MDYTGSSYEGERVNGRIEGKGTYEFPSGTVYTGEFKDGECAPQRTLRARRASPRVPRAAAHAGWNAARRAARRFHGQGTLTFKDCGSLSGTWEHGVLVSGDGQYAFKDGLAYEPDESWGYCDGGADRTFFHERVEGLRPASDEQLANEHPPRAVPKGCYDIGRGYFNPEDELVYEFGDGKHLIGGLHMGETAAWIRAKCRVGL